MWDAHGDAAEEQEQLFGGTHRNETEITSAPTDRQQAYLRHLAARAHEAGMPHLHIASFTRRQAAEWIDYLRLVVEAEERVREILERARQEAEQSSAYLVTTSARPAEQLPPTMAGAAETSISWVASRARTASKNKSASCAGCRVLTLRSCRVLPSVA